MCIVGRSETWNIQHPYVNWIFVTYLLLFDDDDNDEIRCFNLNEILRFALLPSHTHWFIVIGCFRQTFFEFVKQKPFLGWFQWNLSMVRFFVFFLLSTSKKKKQKERGREMSYVCSQFVSMYIEMLVNPLKRLPVRVCTKAHFE